MPQTEAGHVLSSQAGKDALAHLTHPISMQTLTTWPMQMWSKARAVSSPGPGLQRVRRGCPPADRHSEGGTPGRTVSRAVHALTGAKLYDPSNGSCCAFLQASFRVECQNPSTFAPFQASPAAHCTARWHAALHCSYERFAPVKTEKPLQRKQNGSAKRRIAIM